MADARADLHDRLNPRGIRGPQGSGQAPAEFPPPRAFVRLLGSADAGLHFIVGLLLLAVAVIVLWHAISELATSRQPLLTAATTAVNAALFTIIILEVVRTIATHLRYGGFQLRPFLIIGAISAIRSILAVGARLSLEGTQQQPTGAVVRTSLLELAVNAAVVVGLVVALALLGRTRHIGEDFGSCQ